MIDRFDGEYRFLSNFFNCPIVYKSTVYSNAEAAFQAQKNTKESWRFTNLDPSTAKRLGRQVNLRLDWEQSKDQIMYEIVLAKFTQNPPLIYKLIHTDDEELIEGNWWGDTYWGVCKGIGKNKLGTILMSVREQLQRSM